MKLSVGILCSHVNLSSVDLLTVIGQENDTMGNSLNRMVGDRVAGKLLTNTRIPYDYAMAGTRRPGRGTQVMAGWPPLLLRGSDMQISSEGKVDGRRALRTIN